MLRRPGATLSPGVSVASANHVRSNTEVFVKEIVTSRPSRGLEQFFTCIRDQEGLQILDLAGASQNNINFITNLGHRLYSEDFLRTLDDTFRKEEDQDDQTKISHFLNYNLNFQADSFDGVLVWDVLQYLSPALLTATL